MRNFSLKTALAATVSMLIGLVAQAVPVPPGGNGVVTYNPPEKIIQGNQPLVRTYTLSIKSPSNLPAGVSVTVPLNVSILSKPAAVSEAQALTFLTLAPSFTFTGPGETKSTQVTLNVPLGNVAGSYAYLIKTTGWPTGLTIENVGATVNAIVTPVTGGDTSTPSVTLQTPADGDVFTYYPATGNPALVPIYFTASVNPAGSPITGMQAFVNNTATATTLSGVGTFDGSGNGTLQLTTPGTYAISATATNLYGTSTDSADITVVVSAPPPTISVSSPSVGAAYTYDEGEAGASVSVSYTATSVYGNITATSATLDGSPIALSLSGVGTSLTAVGTADLTVTSGSHLLAFTASNDYGAAEVVEVPFTVKELVVGPIIPTVSILSPVDGTTFDRLLGDDPTEVSYTYEANTTGGAIESVTVMIDGTVVSSTVNGLNTADVTGFGSASYSESGTHTLTVTVSNGQATATDSVSFTVDESYPEICAHLFWLPPISLNKTVEGGSTVPVKFKLKCHGDTVRDESVLIAVYEVYDDETTSEPVIYPYGVGSPNPPDYAITGPMYHLNYDTEEGIHHYRIDVIYPLNEEGTAYQLLGTKDLLTKEGRKKGGKGESCDDDDEDDHSSVDSDGHHSNPGVSKGKGHGEKHGETHGDTGNGKGGGEGSFHDGDSKSNSDHSK